MIIARFAVQLTRTQHTTRHSTTRSISQQTVRHRDARSHALTLLTLRPACDRERSQPPLSANSTLKSHQAIACARRLTKGVPSSRSALPLPLSPLSLSLSLSLSPAVRAVCTDACALCSLSPPQLSLLPPLPLSCAPAVSRAAFIAPATRRLSSRRPHAISSSGGVRHRPRRRQPTRGAAPHKSPPPPSRLLRAPRRHARTPDTRAPPPPPPPVPVTHMHSTPHRGRFHADRGARRAKGQRYDRHAAQMKFLEMSTDGTQFAAGKARGRLTTGAASSPAHHPHPPHALSLPRCLLSSAALFSSSPSSR